MARAFKENILLVAQKCLGKPSVGAENRQTILCLLSSAKKKRKDIHWLSLWITPLMMKFLAPFSEYLDTLKRNVNGLEQK